MDTTKENPDKQEKKPEKDPAYFTRSKRRKLCDGEEEFTSTFWTPIRKRKNPICYMPVEVLQLIFKFVTYKELSKSVRRVNHRFKIIAEDILNCSFRHLDKKLNYLILTTELSLAYIQDDMEMKCLAKLLNMMETVKLHYSIVLANTWRYIFNEYYKTRKTCMYGGRLLDVFYDFVTKCLYYPEIIYAPTVVREHILPSEVSKIIQMSKSFCVHFDKVTEEPSPDCLVYSGCKIIDIIDCAKYLQKFILSESVCNKSFSGEYTYYWKNSWFVAIPTPLPKEMEWSQKQRMMHMRLRRLAFAHNDMFLQQDQYLRELMLRPNPDFNIFVRKPGNNVYTGYGEVGDMFFFYGVMNDGAYFQKFSTDEDTDDDFDDVFVDENNNDLNDVARNDSEEDVLYRIPYVGFRMNIEVKCPLSYAPLSILKKLRDHEIEELRTKHNTEGTTQIKIVFECDGASYPRLPTRFEYNFNPHELKRK